MVGGCWILFTELCNRLDSLRSKLSSGLLGSDECKEIVSEMTMVKKEINALVERTKGVIPRA